MAKYNESAAAFVSVLFHSATVTHFMHLQTKPLALGTQARTEGLVVV